jgi:hypothetical protein
MGIDRRTMLKASVAGVGASLLLPGLARADGLPPVPGMLGDRRANEMWFQLDEKTFYHPASEVIDAYGSIGALVGGENPFFGMWDRWMELSALPDYPRNFAAFLTPVKPALTLLSRVQLGTFDQFYPPNSPGFVAALAWFAQGVLYDPRRPAEDAVHTMGALPFYHAWHAYLRGMMFLDISCDRWARIDPVVGFAWAVQSVAKPARDHVNPPLPQATVARLAASWLPRSPERLDHDFRSSPEPEDLLAVLREHAREGE